jgi:hypothetical protein
MSPTSVVASDLRWRKARRSVGNGACVEVALINGQIAVRDSKNPAGTWLQYSRRSWQTFVTIAQTEKLFE